ALVKLNNLEKELEKLGQDKLILEEELIKVNKEKFKNEALKLDYQDLLKNNENTKKELNRLNIEYKKLNEVALTQISFDKVSENNLGDEILNLDILNMTPLDAMNALYMLQNKAKKSK
ncbi:MAG: hypothetical protein RSE41_08120, partial [Clostridia bacterium]